MYVFTFQNTKEKSQICEKNDEPREMLQHRGGHHSPSCLEEDGERFKMINKQALKCK